jgi:hypothetical protein
MKVLEFLKSLVLPRKMASLKNMSALIALFILVLSTYLLSIPFGYTLEKQTKGFKENYHFLPLQEIDVDQANLASNVAELQEILDLECEVNSEGLLECAGLTETSLKKYDITYVKEGITKKIHIFFDWYGEGDKPAINFDSKERDLTFSNANEEYKYVENEEQYFLVFSKHSVIYQAHQAEMGSEELKKTHNNVELTVVYLPLDYKSFLPDFSLKLSDPLTFGNYVITQMLDAYSQYARSTAFIQTFLISIGFPLLMVLLFWLFFRKSGRLNRFKEYFNIAALSSIVPVLLTFGLAWVFPILLNWYIFVFSLFYLFVLFRINNAPGEY